MSDAKAAARPHHSDAMQLGVLPDMFHRTLPHLVALIEQLDFLEFLDGVSTCSSSVLKADREVGGRALKVIAPCHGGFGVGRIGKMRGVVDPGALLLDQNLTIELGGHSIEFGD